MATREVVARVAVLGCGRGDLAIVLAHTSTRCIVAGFDPDRRSIGLARRAAAMAGVADRVTFEVSDQLLGSGYDVVFARIGASAPR